MKTKICRDCKKRRLVKFFYTATDDRYYRLKGFKVELTKEQKRLVLLASMCDVKVSRLVGPFKADTVVDLANYAAALTTLHDEYSSKDKNG